MKADDPFSILFHHMAGDINFKQQSQSQRLLELVVHDICGQNIFVYWTSP